MIIKKTLMITCVPYKINNWYSDERFLTAPSELEIMSKLMLKGNAVSVAGQTLFFGASKSLQMVIAAMKLKDAYSLEGK